MPSADYLKDLNHPFKCVIQHCHTFVSYVRTNFKWVPSLQKKRINDSTMTMTTTKNWPGLSECYTIFLFLSLFGWCRWKGITRIFTDTKCLANGLKDSSNSDKNDDIFFVSRKKDHNFGSHLTHQHRTATTHT